MEIVRKLDSYAEYSPSGTGVHIICRGQLPASGRRRGSVEMYGHARFFTVTGLHVTGTPTTIEQRDEAIAAVHAEYVAAPAGSLESSTGASSAPAVALDDAELLRRMFAARNGRAVAALWSGEIGRYERNDSVADLALCAHLAFWTGGDPMRIDRLFRQSALCRPKWDERRGERTYGELTIKRAIQSMRSSYLPERRAR